MNDFINKVKQTIYNELKPEDILLIDNSNLHAKHKSFVKCVEWTRTCDMEELSNTGVM